MNRFAARLTAEDGRLAAQGRLTVVSFQCVVETEEYNGSFVPWLLLHTDLPEIAASLAPRRLRLAGTVNAASTTLPTAEVRRAYPGNHTVVLEKARWDEEI